MVTVDVVTKARTIAVRATSAGDVAMYAPSDDATLMTADEAVELSRALSFVAGLSRSAREVTA